MIKIFLKKVFKILFFPIRFGCQVFFYAINKIILIRVGTILSERIGHFTADFILHNIDRLEKSKKCIDVYFYNGKCSNRAWEKIFKRNAIVLPIIWERIFKYFFLSEYVKNSIRDIHYGGNTRDPKGLHVKYCHRLALTKKENQKARRLLETLGWAGEKIIALHIRDSNYLEKRLSYPGVNWNYHSYRNSDISTYEKTIAWIVSNGFFVIRLGKFTEKRANFRHRRYVELWQDNFDDDLLDIWISLNCWLMISSGSGIDILSLYSGCTVCFLNALPVYDVFTNAKCLWVPKNCSWKSTGMGLSMWEMLCKSYWRSGDFSAAGIEIVDLNESDILNAVQECLQRIENSWVTSQEEVEIKAKIESIFRRHPNFEKQFGFFHPNFSFGMNWIRSKGPGFLE